MENTTPVSKTGSTFSVVGVCILSAILYQIIVYGFFFIIAIFAMGCGGVCSTSKLPLIIACFAALIFLLGLLLELVLLRKLLRNSKILLIIGLIIVTLLPSAPALGLLASGAISQIKWDSSVNSNKSYANKMNPKITILSLSPAGYIDYKEGIKTISGVDIRLSITAENDGELVIHGDLFDRDFSHYRVTDSEGYTVLQVGKLPTEVVIQIPLNYTMHSVDDLIRTNTLAILASYKPKPNGTYLNTVKYDLDTLIDSGKSIVPVLPKDPMPAFGNRRVVYDVNLNNIFYVHQ